MTSESEGIGGLVFTDQSGNYYVLDREIINSARVPDEQKAELEQIIGSQDTTGFAGSAGLQRLSSLSLIYSFRVNQFNFANFNTRNLSSFNVRPH